MSGRQGARGCSGEWSGRVAGWCAEAAHLIRLDRALNCKMCDDVVGESWPCRLRGRRSALPGSRARLPLQRGNFVALPHVQAVPQNCLRSCALSWARCGARSSQAGLRWEIKLGVNRPTEMRYKHSGCWTSQRCTNPIGGSDRPAVSVFGEGEHHQSLK